MTFWPNFIKFGLCNDISSTARSNKFDILDHPLFVLCYMHVPRVKWLTPIRKTYFKKKIRFFSNRRHNEIFSVLGCRCDLRVSTGECEENTGRCLCRPEYYGENCDRFV